MKKIMMPQHPQWNTFTGRLGGPEGCDFGKDEKGATTWKCDNTHAKAISILSTMPDIDVEGSVEYFEQHGGFCDCEVLFNVESDTDDSDPHESQWN